MFCDKCGRVLLPGELKYDLEIRLWADFDGQLPPGMEKETPETVRKLLQDMTNIDRKVLENDVYKSMEFVLCKICKDHFAANPLNLPLWSNIPDSVPPKEGRGDK